MSTFDQDRSLDEIEVYRIAKELYGGLEEMLKEHRWPEGDKTPIQDPLAWVLKVYGSIHVFKSMHDADTGSSPIVDHRVALSEEKLDVWLTSFYGFTPQNWAMLGFTVEADRRRFLENSRPGALVVVYGTKDLPFPNEAGRVLGVMQVSHETGEGTGFLDEGKKLEKGKNFPERWNYGVRGICAWTIPEEKRPMIDAFADKTYSTNSARSIGRFGKKLVLSEVLKLDLLSLQAAVVFKGSQTELPEWGKPWEFVAVP